MLKIKTNYRTAKDCYYCPYIIKCKDRIQAKMPIDLLANQEKQKVIKYNLMPVCKNQTVEILFSGVIHRTRKARKRFLKHLHHNYDVTAAIKVWNNPFLLKHLSNDALGETKNKNDPMVIANLQHKKDRNVMGYHTYYFENKQKIFIVKTEITIYGYEQFYALYEIRIP